MKPPAPQSSAEEDDGDEVSSSEDTEEEEEEVRGKKTPTSHVALAAQMETYRQEVLEVRKKLGEMTTKEV